MKKVFILLLASIVLIVFLASCTETAAQAEEETSESTSTTSTTVESSTVSIPVYLTDKRVSGVESIYVDISGISYAYEASGEASVESVSTDLKNIDLLSLSGTEMEWFEMRLPEDAELRWIEFGIDSATAVVGGMEVSVEVPHGKIKVVYRGRFNEGEELVLDFDMSQSLVRTGRGMYKLKPVIKPFKRRHGEKDMYTISGKVEETGDPLAGVIVGLLDESTVVRSTYTDDEGKFKLRYVKEGTYTLNIYDITSLPDGSELTDIEATYSTEVYVKGDMNLGEIDIGGGSTETEEETYDIEGKVMVNGEGASDMTVALLDEKGKGVIDSTLTDEDGEFKIEDVREGTYMLNVYDISDLPDGSDLADCAASYSTMLYVDRDLDDIVINIEEATAGESSSTENATVSVSFTDDPSVGLGIDHVYVHVDHITYSYEYDGDFHRLTNDLNKVIDIMSLIGEEVDMTDLPVPSGANLAEVGVKLKSVKVVIGGTTYPVNLTKSEVEVPVDVEVNGSLKLTLDFDMIQSLFKESTGYSFNPVIKGMVEDPKNPQYKITGKVMANLGGYTTQPAPGFVVTLFKGDDLFRLTLTKSDGTFRVFNVPNGDYTLKIYQPQILEPGQGITSLPLLKSEDVTVSSTDLDVGNITVNVSF